MREIREILSEVPDLELVDLVQAGISPAPEEDDLEPYDTFEANARSKPRYLHARSGLPTVADDSGLEVDALEGAPGVRSKRFAPGDSTGIERDLENRGTVEGRIAREPRGSGGFGYDPLFHIPELGRTFGEATPQEKHARSHRGAAFRELAALLEKRP
jgi:XTP/dITP diphosphohydrolase